ncbi:MAG TPA: M50 family metallopeptidase, partial [Saprospiraceae bacterium]|nr:M50 family metallopeptidase [Saprospiraceae bacterium]
PAEGAGLRENDKVIALNSEQTLYFHEFYNKIKTQKNAPVTVTVLRNSKDTVQLSMTTTEEGTIGFAPFGPEKFFEVKREDYGVGQAFLMGFTKGWTFLSDQVKAFGRMFSGHIKPSESLGGFGTFAKLYGTQWDWERFWNMTAIVSLILAFMNLLPIPALDGGHVMFLLWEVFTGRKPSDKFLEYATTAGFVLVLGLVIYANGLDVLRGCN